MDFISSNFGKILNSNFLRKYKDEDTSTRNVDSNNNVQVFKKFDLDKFTAERYYKNILEQINTERFKG